MTTIKSSKRSVSWVIWPLVLSCVSGVFGVNIRRLSIPHWVRNGTSKGVILDCDYVYNENDLRLVVKWFFNDDQEPIYQWIPELKIRHVAGQLYGRLDMDFSINPLDPYSQYRALRIVNVTPELGGKYSCVVSSLAGQDSKFQEMSVYVPATTFQFTFEMEPTGKITFSCLVEGIYPEPTMWLNVLGRNMDDNQKHQKLVTVDPNLAVISAGAVAEFKTRVNSTVFDGSLVKSINEKQLEAGASGSVTVVECVLEIPGSPYRRKRRITYFPSSLGQTSGNGIFTDSHILNLTKIGYLSLIALTLYLRLV